MKLWMSLNKSEHSRLPVYSGTADNVVGILYARDFLHSFRRKTQRKKFNVRTLMRKPVFVPETQSLEKLIETFKANMVHIAVVVDEFGGSGGNCYTFGCCSWKYSGQVPKCPRKGFVVAKLSDNSFLVKGSARLDEIASDSSLWRLASRVRFRVRRHDFFLSCAAHGSVPRVGSRIDGRQSLNSKSTRRHRKRFCRSNCNLKMQTHHSFAKL